MIKIYPIPVGDYQANCYIISKGQDALVIDPGAEATKIIGYLNARNLTPQAILLTHGHFDHIGALETVQKKYNIPVYAHELEKVYLNDPDVNLSSKTGRELISIKDFSEYTFINTDTTIGLMNLEIEIFHVPGHSRGSIAFYFQEDKVLFSGDALFAGSIGRTDLLYGDHNQLIKSINTQLFTLPDETIVYSGHGPATTIGHEKNTNPFFN